MRTRSAAQHLTHIGNTNTEGVLSSSTRFIVSAGTGFLYLAVIRPGTIVYNLPDFLCRRPFTAYFFS